LKGSTLEDKGPTEIKTTSAFERVHMDIGGPVEETRMFPLECPPVSPPKCPLKFPPRCPPVCTPADDW